MQDDEILKGVIFSYFSEKGPETKFWYPHQLEQEILLKISLKTITLLAGESGEATNQMAFIQFPNYNLSNFVYLFGIPNDNVRGKNIAASVSILIQDKYNSLFYTNMIELEERIKTLVSKILHLEQENGLTEDIFIEFYNELKEKIKIFKRHEITTFKIKDLASQDKNPLTEYKYKIGLFGSSCAGKTAILLRFCEEAFRDRYIATNGANINLRTLELKDLQTSVHLNLWEISGQDCYLDMNEKLINGCDAVVFVYDITRLDSFKEIQKWYDWILQKIGYKIGVLVGNKLDLERKVPKDSALRLAKELKLGYIETSALTGTNINLLFENVSKAIITLYHNK